MHHVDDGARAVDETVREAVCCRVQISAPSRNQLLHKYADAISKANGDSGRQLNYRPPLPGTSNCTISERVGNFRAVVTAAGREGRDASFTC